MPPMYSQRFINWEWTSRHKHGGCRQTLRGHLASFAFGLHWGKEKLTRKRKCFFYSQLMMPWCLGVEPGVNEYHECQPKQITHECLLGQRKKRKMVTRVPEFSWSMGNSIQSWPQRCERTSGKERLEIKSLVWRSYFFSQCGFFSCWTSSRVNKCP